MDGERFKGRVDGAAAFVNLTPDVQAAIGTRRTPSYEAGRIARDRQVPRSAFPATIVNSDRDDWLRGWDTRDLEYLRARDALLGLLP